MKNQNKTILAHLQLYGSITSLQAIYNYGVTRLSARIFDLKDQGYNIKSDFKGNKYVTYSLIEEK